MGLRISKTSTVVWECHPAIDSAQETIAKVFMVAGAPAVCTSAHDSSHSHGSAHHQDQPDKVAWAIDLRTYNLFPSLTGEPRAAKLRVFAGLLASALNSHLRDVKEPGRFDVVIEPSPNPHIHCEFSLDRPNIKGWNLNQYVYEKAGA